MRLFLATSSPTFAAGSRRTLEHILLRLPLPHSQLRLRVCVASSAYPKGASLSYFMISFRNAARSQFLVHSTVVLPKGMLGNAENLQPSLLRPRNSVSVLINFVKNCWVSFAPVLLCASTFGNLLLCDVNGSRQPVKHYDHAQLYPTGQRRIKTTSSSRRQF